MNSESWQSRWDAGRIGFHQDKINPWLQRYWRELNVAPGSTVFVPLCGKSLDMLWLREQGHAVVGVEIVTRAVEAFFAENNLTATRQSRAALTLWESAGIKIYEGDFFKLAATEMSGINAVYDRASLVALPPDLRRQYVAHLNTILPGKINILLVTMDYPQTEMDGPPFAVTEEEVLALYEEDFRIKPVCSEDILAANPRFQQQGLSRLVERVYVLERKNK